jgi:hypothetical protein
MWREGTLWGEGGNSAYLLRPPPKEPGPGWATNRSDPLGFIWTHAPVEFPLWSSDWRASAEIRLLPGDPRNPKGDGRVCAQAITHGGSHIFLSTAGGRRMADPERRPRG